MTPFENVMRVLKQAEMLLLLQASHDWSYPTSESRFRYTALYVYGGWYVGVSKEAALMLFKLLREIKDIKITHVGLSVRVECALSLKEKDEVERLMGCQE